MAFSVTSWGTNM